MARPVPGAPAWRVTGVRASTARNRLEKGGCMTGWPENFVESNRQYGDRAFLVSAKSRKLPILFIESTS